MLSGPLHSQKSRFAGLPLTRRVFIKPDLGYLASSAILPRLGVAGVRVWMNRPSNIHDPNVSLSEKRQGMCERFFVEIIGTPLFILVMHLVPDLAAMAMEKSGWIRPQLKPVAGVSQQHMTLANQVLKNQVGSEELIGNMLFNPKKLSLTAFTEKLEQAGASHLLKNPAFAQAAEGWFKRTRLGTTLALSTGIVAGTLFGGLGIQLFNDNVFAPLCARLFKPATTTDTPVS